MGRPASAAEGPNRPGNLRRVEDEASVATGNDLGAQGVELLQRLIRIDTANPPGDEEPAQELLAEMLEAAGFECELLGRGARAAEPGRAAARRRPRARRCACLATRTPSRPTPPSGASTPGRATSWTERFGVAGLRT